MPSTKKRVNLTIPDDIYERLQAYKINQGISNDASACLQLMVKQLNGQDQTDMLLNYISKQSIEKLNEISKEGFTAILSAQDH